MTTSHVAIDPPGQGAPEQQQLPPASPERGGGGGGGGARLWFRVACGAAAVGVACWLLRSFLLHNRHATDRLITRASIVGALAAVTYLLGIPKLLPRRTPEILVLATVALLVAGAARWNKSYERYWRSQRSPHEVFRHALHRPYTPVYGRPAGATSRMIAITIAGGVALACGGAAFAVASEAPRRRRLAWAALVAGQLAAIVCFARSEQPPRLPLDIAGYGIQQPDVTKFTGVRDLLANYTARMPALTWSNRHYPPGNVLVWFVQDRLGLVGAFKAVVVLAVLWTMVPLLWLCRELRMDERTSRLVVALYGCSAAVAIHTTVNKTPLVILFAVLAVWCVIRALNNGRVLPAAVAGAAILAYALFSFSVAIVAAMIAVTVALAVVTRCTTVRRAAQAAAVVVGVLVAGWLLLRVGTGLDLVACMRQAVSQHARQQASNPYRPLKPYAIRSTGNLLAYAVNAPTLFALSVPAAMSLFMMRRRRQKDGACDDRSMLRALLVATWLTVFGAGFSGLFWLETERIWTFLTPFMAIAAAVGLRSIVMPQRGDDLDRRGVISVVATIVAGVALLATYEAVFLPYVP